MRYALQFQKTHDFEVPEDDADEDLWFQYCFDCSQEKHPLLTHVLVLKQSSLNELLGFFCNWLQDAKIFFQPQYMFSGYMHC
uniref:Gem-associated protein 2 n=1 Tax=Triatoma infestans TaxID=30076 RepID=A0A171A3G2_TRIIF